MQTKSKINRCRNRCGLYSPFAAAAVGVLLAGSVTALTVVAQRFPAAQSEQRELRVVDVTPTGWRRTVDGWERADRWFAPASHSSHDIHQWLAMEHSSRPSVVGTLLDGLRTVHPLILSASLLMTVLTIVLVNERASKANRKLPSECGREPL